MHDQWLSVKKITISKSSELVTFKRINTILGLSMMFEAPFCYWQMLISKDFSVWLATSQFLIVHSHIHLCVVIQALADIEVAMNIIKHKQADENPLDTHYNDMKCEVQPVPKGSKEYNVSIKAVQTFTFACNPILLKIYQSRSNCEEQDLNMHANLEVYKYDFVKKKLV